MISNTWPTKDALLSFLKRATALFSKDELKLIEKNRSNTRNTFFVSRYRYNGKGYHFFLKEGAEKPPKDGIWIEATINQKVDTDACLYRRDRQAVGYQDEVCPISGSGARQHSGYFAWNHGSGGERTGTSYLATLSGHYMSWVAA